MLGTNELIFVILGWPKRLRNGTAYRQGIRISFNVLIVNLIYTNEWVGIMEKFLNWRSLSNVERSTQEIQSILRPL